ncbi:MAG: hypothetical protein IJI25_07005 [Eubacterium sp.]|nr:hypothetical protein [Eubacterium sp.]
MQKTPDRIKIDCFHIEGKPGGSQDWFGDYWMHIGGCGALAACDLVIYLAKNLGLSGCCHFDPGRLTRRQYIELGMIMKSYIRPRPGGVIRTSIFTRGLGKYLRDRGYQADFAICRGHEDYVKACRFVKAVLSRNLPIACLMLRHKEKVYANLSWHWFMITGYEMRNDRMVLLGHTYGTTFKVDFEGLWNTGRWLKGGLVAVSRIRHADI